MADMIDRYQHDLTRITDEAERQTDTIYARFSDGDLTQAEAIAATLAVVEHSAARASAMAETVASAWLTKLESFDVLPLGLPAPRLDYTIASRIEGAFTGRDGVTKINMVLRSAAYDSASSTWTRYTRHKAPDRHWRRRSEGGKCQPCNDLAARNRELRQDTPMWRHTGCRCVQQIT